MPNTLGLVAAVYRRGAAIQSTGRKRSKLGGPGGFRSGPATPLRLGSRRGHRLAVGTAGGTGRALPQASCYNAGLDLADALTADAEPSGRAVGRRT
jgi:hypothetical protein